MLNNRQGRSKAKQLSRRQTIFVFIPSEHVATDYNSLVLVVCDTCGTWHLKLIEVDVQLYIDRNDQDDRDSWIPGVCLSASLFT